MVSPQIELSAYGRRSGPNQMTTIVAPFIGMSDVAMLAQGAPPKSANPIAAISLELANGQTVRIDSTAAIADAQSYLYARAGYTPLLAWCR